MLYTIRFSLIETVPAAERWSPPPSRPALFPESVLLSERVAAPEASTQREMPPPSRPALFPERRGLPERVTLPAVERRTPPPSRPALLPSRVLAERVAVAEASTRNEIPLPSRLALFPKRVFPEKVAALQVRLESIRLLSSQPAEQMVSRPTLPGESPTAGPARDRDCSAGSAS